jgi:hypothetical protein
MCSAIHGGHSYGPKASLYNIPVVAAGRGGYARSSYVRAPPRCIEDVHEEQAAKGILLTLNMSGALWWFETPVVLMSTLTELC